MTIASSVNRAGAEALRFLHQLNKQVGIDESAYGEEMQSSVGVVRGPRQFIIGFIPPDVEVNFVPVAQQLGKFLTTAIPPKDEKPEGSDKTKKGAVKPFAAGVEERTPKFWADFVAMCNRLHCKPEDMVAAILMESGFNPAAATGQAKGLNQIIKSVALSPTKPLMTKEQWERYGQMSAEEQLPFVEKYFQSFRQPGWANATHIYAANIGGNSVGHFKENGKDGKPDRIIYDGFYEFRGPPGPGFPNGVRPQKDKPETWGPQGYPGQKIVQEMANFDGNTGLSSGDGKIKISDIEARLDGQKRSRPFSIAMENIARFGGSSGGIEAFDFAKVNGPGGVENGIIMGASDLTDQEEDDPMKQIGRHISVDNDRNDLYVKRQVDELKEQIAIARITPPIAMLINPRSFTRHHEHQVDYAKGRRRPIVSMWHEKPIVISGKGTTAGQYVMKASGEGGLNATSRIQSVSYENLMSLVYFYKNNGMLYTSGLGDDMNRGVALIAMSIYIYYDGTMYIGSFDNFSVTDSAEKPHTLEYNFGFTCRYEVKVTSVSDASLAGITGAT